MAKFFDQFPTLAYSINKTDFTSNDYELVTNIFVRLRVLRERLNAAFDYYEYVIKETDRPDTLAENFYGDAELHWLVLLMNDIVDPLYGWPLKPNDFYSYLANKYRQNDSQSDEDVIAWAQTNWHHYERVIRIVNTLTQQVTETRLPISEREYNNLNVDFYNYDDTPGNPDVIVVGADTVQVYEYKTRVSYYTWEDQENEKKRNIKLIKREHVPMIKYEFDNIMTEANPAIRPMMRTIT